MTALVFALQSEQICIAMDTLVIGAKDRMPLYFQRKFLSIPESDLVVAGTGHAGFINGWLQFLQAHFRETTIDDLDAEVPGILCASVEAVGGLDGLTATIYHFGYSIKECKYVGYVYRSERNFRSERLQEGLGYKPVIPIATSDDIRFPDFLIGIILEQQRRDNLQPITERVGIGGEIEFVVMSDRLINVETVYRFSSYESELIQIGRRTKA
ncbi:hypothetical protein [Herbaspirillum huttiense]|uniref:hypothetical protein n=1 Tax=Herbaspirillum huttiense TaxID=863372 RepID=UPI0039AF207D